MSAPMSGLYGPLAAVLVPKGRTLVARPLFERGDAIALKQEGRRGRPLAPNELVLIEPAGVARTKQKGRHVVRQVGRVVRRIGRPDNARDVLEALMLEQGLARRFDGAVENHARKMADAPDEYARRDLTELPTFTMDPAGAKDYDDAISARAEDGGVRVWVHIADVSAFVRPGDPVDQEARRRATSVYVPGAVEPMLPEALSNEACSLVPGMPRRTVSVELLFDGERVANAAFYRSTIRSDARLTYEQVDAIFAGAARAEDPWARPLELARTVSGALERRRQERHALAVESSEPEFEFGPAGGPTAVTMEQQTESHKVIEHLMIAANEQVAEYLEQHRLPALYRVHERPDPVAVSFLADQLAALGVPTPPLPDHFTGQQAEELVGALSELVVKHARTQGHGAAALNSLVLRSLKQAVYSPQNLGHSGLRSACYCHFTSPIRRYPDLIVHRALLAGLGVDDAAPQARDLPDDAEWTSARERTAMKVERQSDDIVRAFLLEKVLADEYGWRQAGSSTPFHGDADASAKARRRPPKFTGDEAQRAHAAQGPAFAAEIVGVIGGGLFVAFGPELSFEGFVALRELKAARGGFWNLDEFQVALVDEESGHRVALGDAVEVRVLRLQTARARVDLLPVTV